MKKEVLFEAIGKINSETVERNALFRQDGHKVVNWKRWIASVASLAVIVGAGLFAYHQLKMNDKSVYLDIGIEDIVNMSQEIFPEQEKMVDISSLLLAQGDMRQEALRISQVRIGDYTALYEGVDSVSHDVLAAGRGKELEENQGWYKVSGHEELQYLIRECDGECTLWKFESFLTEEYSYEYPYKDVLEIVYGITSAEDIHKVTVTAANMDNSDEGKGIQEEIGQYEIASSLDIRQLYDILSGLTCYGGDHWDMIDYGADDAGMAESVQMGRCLAIELDNGIIIDSMKYTAVSGMFYEYGGVAYNRLSVQDKETVDRIFQIENYMDDTIGDLPVSPAEDVQTENAASLQTEDVSVNKNTYQEAHRYPEDIERIQAAISQAMVDKELPFVISSGIYENPVRIVVAVNTTDEASIKKVKEFDTVGGVIEILYKENGIMDKEERYE